MSSNKDSSIQEQEDGGDNLNADLMDYADN